MKLAIVTATTDPFKSATYWDTWRVAASAAHIPLVLVVNGIKDKFDAHEKGFVHSIGDNTDIRDRDVVHIVDDYLGTVPAFAEGFQIAMDAGAEIICCFHDDLQIHDPLWPREVDELFTEKPECWLAGFGGAMGVGREGMYDEEFDPVSLARHSFGSNLVDAEAHGERWRTPRRVAVLDGFSLICRVNEQRRNPFRVLADLGIVHHAYDVALGAMVARASEWDDILETWYLPIECHHAGGRTAVLDEGYRAWAKTKTSEGDQGFWLEAHRIVYDKFRDVLPFHVEE